jgi:hypothetical protein
MNKIRIPLTRSLLALAALLASLTACMERETRISFSEDVKPVLDEHCIGCHQAGAEGFEASGLDLTSHAAMMRGARNGPMVIAGDSLGSNLIVLIEGRADPSINMPHSGSRIPQTQIDKIKAWVEQGAQNN